LACIAPASACQQDTLCCIPAFCNKVEPQVKTLVKTPETLNRHTEADCADAERQSLLQLQKNSKPSTGHWSDILHALFI
jgi:hypothetical protein